MERSTSDLGPFFHPKSIAIVGVPREQYRFGGLSYLHKLQECGYPGRLYPINPRATEIRGIKAYPDLTHLPEVPDLVIICLPAPAVLDILAECARVGARHVHVLSSGFRELGTREGARLEEDLAAFSKQNGLKVMGPNCMGPYCPAGGLTPWGAIPGRPGPVGIISQSGTITQRITEHLCSLGLGIAKAVSIGNAAVLDCLDYLAFMAQDDQVRVIGIYLESVPDGRAFLRMAREINENKPIILWKGGESRVGASTALSHTGGMAGPRHLWEAFFRQSGAIRVRTMDEWADTILGLSLLPPPRGRGVFLVGGGGGHSVVNGDTIVRHGLDVPPLSESSIDKLRRIVPAVGSIAGNPLDDWQAYDDPDHFGEVLAVGYEDPGLDMILADRILPRASYHMRDLPDPTPRVIEFMEANKHRKPTVFTVDFDGGDPELAARGCSLLARFCEAGIPTFPSPQRAARTLAHLYRYHETRRERSGARSRTES